MTAPAFPAFRFLARLALAAALAPSLQAAPPAAATGLIAGPVVARGSMPQAVAAPTFAEASRLFRSGRHAAAYGRFVTLANEGDMHAARVALVMHRFGPTLFGSDWDATTEELAEWSRLARAAEQADLEARLRIGKSK